MKKHTLQEISKLLAGLVLGKIFFLWWASTVGLFPVSMWGVIYSGASVFPAIVFNIGIFLILIHFGWNIGKIPSMRENTYFSIAGMIFALVAILHAWRLLFGGLDFILFGWAIPVWFSWVGVIIAGFLCYMSFRLRKHIS